MDNLYILLGQRLLTLLSCYVCYLLGKRTAQNEREKERYEGAMLAKQARDSLRDDDVVERLHERFKR